MSFLADRDSNLLGYIPDVRDSLFSNSRGHRTSERTDYLSINLIRLLSHVQALRSNDVMGPDGNADSIRGMAQIIEEVTKRQ